MPEGDSQVNGSSEARRTKERELGGRGDTSAALGPGLRWEGLIGKFNFVHVVFFPREALLVRKDLFHQEPGGLVDVYIILGRGFKPPSEAVVFTELVHLGRTLAALLLLVTLVS